MQRDNLEFERLEVTRRIDTVHHEFRELANRLFPFTLAPRLTAQFRAALVEVTAHPSNPDRRKLSTILSQWKTENVPKRSAAWSKSHWSDLAKLAASLERTRAATKGTPNALKEVGDGALALVRLNEAEAIARQRARSMRDELESLTTRRTALDVALERADNAASGYLLEELRLAEQRVGATETQLHARQEVLHTAHGRRVTLERERQRLLEQQNNVEATAHRADLATRSARALAAYERRLLDQKIGQLRTEFVRLFNFIARKTNLLADMQIDPETFATELLDPEGRPLPKSALSAGEQQIYAVSLLWALARTSGRPLPMIVDTPLARLDSEHRDNLVQRYFPSASHQVILLSTDTEIDEDLYERLSESVSHAYHLEFIPTEKRTRVVPGYFFGNREIRERVRAV
jgi:DNA sulfur modification protein DndD